MNTNPVYRKTWNTLLPRVHTLCFLSEVTFDRARVRKLSKDTPPFSLGKHNKTGSMPSFPFYPPYILTGPFFYTLHSLEIFNTTFHRTSSPHLTKIPDKVELLSLEIYFSRQSHLCTVLSGSINGLNVVRIGILDMK